MSIDTSRDQVKRMVACLPFATLEAGVSETQAVMLALLDERDQLRADLQAERTARDNAERRLALLQETHQATGDALGTETFKREQAEARVRELEAERDALRDGKPTPGWGKRVPNLNVTGASGS